MELFHHPLFSSANLLSYYRLQGNGNDSKSTRHGSASNVTFSEANGIFGQGGGFNGTNSQIGMGNVLDFNNNSACSFNAWIKTTATGSRLITNKQDGQSPFRGYGFAVASGKLSFAMRHDAASNWEVRSTIDVNDGVWHMVTVTKTTSTNRSGVTLYIDGLQVSVTLLGETATVNETLNGASFGIGRRIPDGDAPFNGQIDDVAIFNRVLTASEVNSLYASAKGFFNLL